MTHQPSIREQSIVSAVVCVKNGSATLAKTIESLRANRVDEIVVIDGLSEDNSMKIAEQLADRVYSDGGRGLAFARQMGADVVKGEFIFYVDSDVSIPNDHTVQQMIEEMTSNGWTAAHCQIVDPRVHKSYWEFMEDQHFGLSFNKPGEKRFIGTLACMVKREAVIGYTFDISFLGACEDAEFFARLREKGERIGVTHQVAYHLHRASLKEFAKQRIWYGRGNARMFKKRKELIVLFAPIAIAAFGLVIAPTKLGPSSIPFYLAWALFLGYGTIIGIFPLVKRLQVGESHRIS